MKVLIPGRDQKGWSKEFKCNVKEGGCGSILLVEEADIICWDTRDYQGSYDETLCKFVCGHCGVDNFVDVPYDVEDRRKKK